VAYVVAGKCVADALGAGWHPLGFLTAGINDYLASMIFGAVLVTIAGTSAAAITYALVVLRRTRHLAPAMRDTKVVWRNCLLIVLVPIPVLAVVAFVALFVISALSIEC